MAHKNLTQLAVERLKPTSKSTVYWDTNLPGFGLRISPRGKKVWICMYSVSGRSVMETIAPVAVLPSVAEARSKARESMLLARSGVHPVHERKRLAAAEKAAEAADKFTFKVMAERYIEQYAEPNTRERTCYETKRLLMKAAAWFGDRPVRAIRKADVIEMIGERRPNIFGTSGLTEATHLLIMVRRCFRWAIEQDLVEADPTTGVRKPLRQKVTRDRVLSDAEIVAFWRGCDEIGWPFGPVFKLMLLTGQRKREVAGLRWGELDLPNKVWRLPGSRTKNRRPHDVALSDLALEVIAGLDRPPPGKPDLVFTTTGTTPVSGFHYAKRKIAEMMDSRDWVLHDGRRSVATNMQKLKIRLEVTEAVLNHVSGSRAGVVGIYQRYNFAEEKGEALTAWSRYLEALIYPERVSNVVALRG
jgi:integrase